MNINSTYTHALQTMQPETVTSYSLTFFPADTDNEIEIEFV